MTARLLLLAAGMYGVCATNSRADDNGLKALQGEWMAVKVFGPDGMVMPMEELEKTQPKWTFGGGGKAVFSTKDGSRQVEAKYTYSINSSKSPNAIDLTTDYGLKQFGIYKIEKGALTLCLTGSPEATKDDRPKEFAVKDKAGIMLVMERPAKK